MALTLQPRARFAAVHCKCRDHRKPKHHRSHIAGALHTQSAVFVERILHLNASVTRILASTCELLTGGRDLGTFGQTCKFLLCSVANNGGTDPPHKSMCAVRATDASDSATYDQLEKIIVDISAFENVSFFNVTVGADAAARPPPRTLFKSTTTHACNTLDADECVAGIAAGSAWSAIAAEQKRR